MLGAAPGAYRRPCQSVIDLDVKITHHVHGESDTEQPSRAAWALFTGHLYQTTSQQRSLSRSGTQRLNGRRSERRMSDKKQSNRFIYICWPLRVVRNSHKSIVPRDRLVFVFFY